MLLEMSGCRGNQKIWYTGLRRPVIQRHTTILGVNSIRPDSEPLSQMVKLVSKHNIMYMRHHHGISNKTA